MQALMPPFSFRFAEGEDQSRYGDGWWTFDEAKLGQLRARDLIALEEQLRAELNLASLLAAVRSFQAGEARGALAVMWLAVRLAGRDDDLADFNPLVMVGETRLGEAPDADPPAGASSPSPTSAEA